MKAVIQRVKNGTLSVDGQLISSIGVGLCVYLGVESGDSELRADYVAKKIYNIRIFEDENGKMNKSLNDVNGEILLISQFTLCADTSGGNRPSFVNAEKPDRAIALYEYTAKKLREMGATVKLGVFGADMQIIQHNDGPVTIILEKRD
ncbi:MAG: D-tyrosyl-tRNA(Tyr) deacylase [Clostridia bacterium]|nr:D-tyrosyl-tRNA(Tyr) deacylase [Clostridia bacterium]